MLISSNQQQVINWLQDDNNLNDAVVNSVAGSGKSTLIKLAADAISSTNIRTEDCLILVFNKKNKIALVEKLDPCWRYSISTVHSAGYKVLRRYLGVKGLNLVEQKYRHLAKTLDWFNGSNPKQARIVSLNDFLKLAEFIRLTLCPLNAEAVSKIIRHYGLNISLSQLEKIILEIRRLFDIGISSAANEAKIDHTDMLWLPLVWQVNQTPGFKFAQRVMVDEAQDMSKLQLEFVLSLTHQKAKMLFVGDRAQSINGFCGADTESFQNIQVRLQAQEFVLPTCYRCPKTHIGLINKLYPEIPITPRDNAQPGTIEVISESSLWDESLDCRIRPGDLVIARCSNVLVDLHLKLITKNIPSNLVGSHLKQELINLVEDISEQTGFKYQEFIGFAQSYLKSRQNLCEQNKTDPVIILQLEDKIKAVKAVYYHFKSESLSKLTSSITKLFGTEEEETVILSTVHRAKGMEAKRVYIAEPVALPLLWENQKLWQKQQEQNLLYVALSRSTDALFLIGNAFWYENKVGSTTKPESDAVAIESSNIAEIVRSASSEELERYLKTIELEQGRRVSQEFKGLV